MLQCCASLHISLIHELTPVIPQHHKLQPWALLVASCCGWHGVESSLHRWVSCNLDSTGSGHYTTFGRTTCPVSRLHFGSLDVWPISMTCFPIWPHLYWVPHAWKSWADICNPLLRVHAADWISQTAAQEGISWTRATCLQLSQPSSLS